MPSSNLAGWLFGNSTKSRELRETRDGWDETERLWRQSRFGQSDLKPQIVEIIGEIRKKAQRYPARPISLAMCEALWDLLAQEPVREIYPNWPIVESDPEAAIEFRTMMAARKRWCLDYDRMFAEFKRACVDAMCQFIDRLPEVCFDDWDEGKPDVFEVPLLDLIDRPELLVEGLFGLPYDHTSLQLGLFEKVRAQSALNILVASGLPPQINPFPHHSRLTYPRDAKNKTGAQVAELYLQWLPQRILADVPVPFHIPETSRYEHCHVVGGTGHGKTQLLQKMIHADLIKAQEDGRSVIVIDSQGDLINKLVRLDLFSPAANGLAERLVLIDPADVEYPAALNLFDAHLDRVREYSPADRERVLNGVVELYELFFGAFLGAELTQKQGVVFRYLARLMLAIPGATINTLIEIMEDGRPFKPYIETLEGAARHFFETEFFHPSFAATKKQIIRRLWGVLSTPAFERMFTQPKNKLDLFEAMNEGKIILVSTAKDLLKKDGSQLLGRFFVAMIMQAALERSTLKEYLRTPAFVYIDEAQEYFDENVEIILTQARKYRVGLTVANQALDQGSPALRSALLSNTSIKCVGGVSAKDARALSAELHTTSDFIESMKRRIDRSEFALWVKQQTDAAIRLTVPLGFLERQPTLSEEDFETLLSRNRERYCGTLADRKAFPLPAPIPVQPEPEGLPPIPSAAPFAPEASTGRVAEPVGEPPARPRLTPEVPLADPQLGKGGRTHRYLQSLVKELAEQRGLRATIEAPLPNNTGQVDVLIERDGVVAAVEISVSTPVEYERINLRKCLDAGHPRVAIVLAKSKVSQSNYRAALAEGIADMDRERVVFLTPEEVPDFVAGLAPPPAPTERIVRGYRVKGSLSSTTPEEARARRGALARLIAKSLAKGSS